MKQTYQTGIDGEKAAEDYLTGMGMTCLERRYKTKVGEIDLILRDGETVVFVEVKARMTGDAGWGLMAVDGRKQKRVAQAAMMYLMRKKWTDQPVRFDVLEIRKEEILYVPNAFQPARLFY